MIGTILNVVGIVVGSLVGFKRRRPLTLQTDTFCKIVVFGFTVYYGLRMTWVSLNGRPLQILKQLLLAVLALTIGRLCGRLAGLQTLSNALGKAARDRIDSARSTRPDASDGFKVCAALFCIEPLATLGAIQDGLSSYFYPLAVKAVIDGLAMITFAPLFGWRALLCVLPVAAFQGTLTLLCIGFLGPFLQSHGLLNSINAVTGLLVFSVALVLQDILRIPLADYLPSLFIAPLAAWLLGW